MRSNGTPTVSGFTTGASIATRSCRFSMVLVHLTAGAIPLPSTPITFLLAGTAITEVGPTTQAPALLPGILPVDHRVGRQEVVHSARRLQCQHRLAEMVE